MKLIGSKNEFAAVFHFNCILFFYFKPLQIPISLAFAREIRNLEWGLFIISKMVLFCFYWLIY